MVAIVSAVEGGGGKGVVVPSNSTDMGPVRQTRNVGSRCRHTFVQSENPDSTLVTPCISNPAGCFRDLSESDDRLESWEFRRQTEKRGHILRLSKYDAEI